jgi:hypothetical protein
MDLLAGCGDSQDPVKKQQKNLKSDSPAVRAVATEELAKARPAAASARAAVTNCLPDSIPAIRAGAAKPIKQIDGIRPDPDDKGTRT